MSDILNKIIEYKREEIELSKKRWPLVDVEEHAKEMSSTRGFTNALRNKIEQGKFALIAEIKKASPSKGLIREDFDPIELARAYEAGGAACLSVLTDTPSFQGRPEYLTQARQAVNIPALRKDFMIDPYQMATARAWGADCVLLIMACLELSLAKELNEAAKSWDMDVLVEVHNAQELELALEIDTPLIGINNRDLKIFETKLETTEQLAPSIHKSKIVISESGIKSHEDLIRLEKVGVKTFLVGESLMRHQDVKAATEKLLLGP